MSDDKTKTADKAEDKQEDAEVPEEGAANTTSTNEDISSEDTPQKEDTSDDSHEDEAQEASSEDGAPTPEPEEKGKWYVVHTQSGFEAKAKEGLEQRIKTLGFEDRIFEVIVPMRDIVTINKGTKRQKKEKVFPGYILVRMELSNDSWIVVRTTQGITGFVGAGTKPTPISQKEVQAIMKFVKQEQPKFKAKFSVGEAVKVTDGPFSDFVGTIKDIDENKGKVTVLVSIFGRETPVELDFLQVSKL